MPNPLRRLYKKYYCWKHAGVFATGAQIKAVYARHFSVEAPKHIEDDKEYFVQ